MERKSCDKKEWQSNKLLLRAANLHFVLPMRALTTLSPRQPNIFTWFWKRAIAQFRYINIQPQTIDFSTRLRGINYRVCGVYSPEPRGHVYCFKLNFKISKLAYLFFINASKNGILNRRAKIRHIIAPSNKFPLTATFAAANKHLKTSIGFRLISELNLKYLLLPTRLLMVSLVPTLETDLLKNYHPSRDLRSSKKKLLVLPAFNTNSYGRRAFSVVAPLLWNSLARHIRVARSLEIFKDGLKLLSLYAHDYYYYYYYYYY